MNIQANIVPTTGSPQLTPRAAHAIESARIKAERPLPAVTDTQLSEALRREYAADLPESLNSKVEISVDRDTGQVIGRILDRTTGALIVQIPSEEMVRLLRATKEALGPLVDFKA